MILDVIRDITARKRAKHIYPDYALFIETYNRVGGDRKAFSAEVRELRDAGFITVGRTINDAYLKLNEDGYGI